MAGQRLVGFFTSATDQQLHFRVALERIDGHDRSRHAALRETAQPDIDVAGITRFGLCQEAVVQRIANIRVQRMCTTARPVKAYLRVRDQGVRLLPELFAVDISYLSSLDVCLPDQLVERIDDDIRDCLRAGRSRLTRPMRASRRGIAGGHVSARRPP
jgi:hypothetical protein